MFSERILGLSLPLKLFSGSKYDKAPFTFHFCHFQMIYFSSDVLYVTYGSIFTLLIIQYVRMNVFLQAQLQINVRIKHQNKEWRR